MRREYVRPQSGRKLPLLTPSVFAEFGADTIVYLKEVEVDGQPACAIYSANGQKLGMASDRKTAFAAALVEDRTPVSVQ